MKELITRTLTGIVFVAVLIGSILWSHYSLAVLFLIITFIGLNEYYDIVNKIHGIKVFKIYGLITGSIIYILFSLVTMGLIEKQILLIIFLLLIIPFGIEIFRIKESNSSDVAQTLLGVLYVVIPFSALNFFVNPTLQKHNYSPDLLLGYFIIVWCYDILAYVIGSLAGKRKLSKEVSPDKTWEGTLGAAILTIGIAYIVSLIFSLYVFYQWAIIAVIIIVFGTFGDLAESRLKRSINVKDSGRILPAHGGILDRFDGVLFSAPVLLIYVLLF